MERSSQIKIANIDAAITLCNSLGSSLGPRGSDKMITDAKKKTIVTNDGATILKTLKATHPIMQILSNLSQTQDKVCGDGTTSVVILTGAILKSLKPMLAKGVHVSRICDAMEKAKKVIFETIEKEKLPIIQNGVMLTGDPLREALIKAAVTTLNSKVVSSIYEIAEVTVDAVLKVNGEMCKIKILKKMGGSLENTHFVEGCVIDKELKGAKELKKTSRVALLQFCLSPPKTNIDSKIILSDAEMMERVIKEEREYLLKICKTIKKEGIDLLFIQKSILREGLSDLALHYLTRLGISVVNDIERSEIDFLSKNLNIRPVSDILLLNSSKVAEVPVEIEEGLLKIKNGNNVTLVIRSGDPLMLDEAERSVNDALWVAKSLLDDPYLIPGGGTVEMCIARELILSNNPIFSELSRAFEEIPFLLARNAGLNAVDIVGKLRISKGGVNVRIGMVSDMVDEEVVQPVKVMKNEVELALETAQLILMIDDILPSTR